MRILVVLVLSMVPSLAFATGVPPRFCGAPAELRDGWQAAAPAKEGFDPKLICAIASVPSEDLVVVVTAQAAPDEFMDVAGSATLDMVLHALEQPPRLPPV